MVAFVPATVALLGVLSVFVLLMVICPEGEKVSDVD